MNNIDNKYATQVYDHIDNVVDVDKVKDGVYNISIA